MQKTSLPSQTARTPEEIIFCLLPVALTLVVASTLPLNPALHRQPLGVLSPSESLGQATAEQTPEKKGEALVALMEPLKPALDVQHPK